MSKMKEYLAKLDYFDGIKDGKKDLWKALKFSNEQPDGSLYISPERMVIINETFERLG
jgi:hypothetical protein